jgi:hypothetical protein
MTRRDLSIVNTALFTLVVPGTVAVAIPMWLLGGFRSPDGNLITWLGAGITAFGDAVYFRCAWEFAVRGLGTPAPIAPTLYLVTTALHPLCEGSSGPHIRNICAKCHAGYRASENAFSVFLTARHDLETP